MQGWVVFSLFILLASAQLLQFPTNVKWADINVKGSMNLDEFGDQRAQVSGNIQYNAPSATDNSMHTKLQTTGGWNSQTRLVASPQELKVATIGSIPGMEGCNLVSIPSSSVVCKDWINHGGVTINGHLCDRYQRDCQVTLSEQMLDDHPELSSAVKFVVYTEKDQPYLIQSNVTSVVDGAEFRTSLSLFVTNVGNTQPSADSLKIPADCLPITP